MLSRRLLPQAGLRRVLLIAGAMTVTASVFVPALADDSLAGRYVLEPKSEAAVGCLDLCRCALRQVPDLSGSFALDFVETDSLEGGVTLTRYRVRDVHWRIGTDPASAARGEGTLELRTDGETTTQAFDLQLSIDGEPPVAFSNTRRERTEGADEIHARVRPTDEVCFGQIFDVRARRASVPFVWGDCNADGAFDIGDILRIVLLVFQRTEEVDCPASCDPNGDGEFSITDAVVVLNFLFLQGTAAPSGAFPGCAGGGPGVECSSFSGCG